MEGGRSTITASDSRGGEQQRRGWYNVAALVTALVPVASASFAPPQPPPKLISLALIPHHEQVRRRKLEYARLNRTWLEDEVPFDMQRNSGRRTEAQVLSAMYQSSALDNGFGTHYVDLWCGTPTPRRQTLLVTNDGFTAFPCLGCTNCGDDGHHTDALYNQRTSASFRALTCNECYQGQCVKSGIGNEDCRIENNNNGSSWSAFEAVDICYVGGPHDHPLTVSTSIAQSASTTSSFKDVANPDGAASFAFPLTFGCQTKVSESFRTQLADGVIGMGNHDTSFWSQMHKAGKIKDKLFSLCFSRQPTAERQGTEAGAMTLGGSDPRMHTSPMVYTSAPKGFSGDGFYPVHVRRIYLRQGGGGNSALVTSSQNYFKIVPVGVSEAILNQGEMIVVHPGASETFFSSVLSAPFDTAWRELTGKKYDGTSSRSSNCDGCYSSRSEESTFDDGYASLTADQVNLLPTILFQLQGDEVMNGPLVKSSTAGVVTGLAGSLDPAHPLDIILAIPPSHYMEYVASQNKYVTRFHMKGSQNVLGTNFMMGHDVMFDVASNRIGWAESHCDHSKLMKTVDFSEVKVYPTNGSKAGNGENASDVGLVSEVGSTGQANASTAKTSSSSHFVLIALGILGGILILAMIVGRADDVSWRGVVPPRREYHMAPEFEMAAVVAEEVEVVDSLLYRDYQPCGKADYHDEPIAVPTSII